MSDEQDSASYERLGAKRLGLVDVIAQSVGFMGPVFSVAFVIPLVIGVISASGKGGGAASPLSVLIAGVGIVALGWIISRYARRIHSAGSLYDYVSRGLGSRAGVAAGWLYYMGVVVLTVSLLLLVGGYLQSTILTNFKVNPLPPWAWTLLLTAGLFLALYFGVRISTRAQLALAGISLTVVLGFFIMVMVKLGSANSLVPFKPSSSVDGWSGIFFGVLYGVLMFTGFETAANLAEESPKPHRHVPIAVLATAAVATLWFVLAAYVEVAGFHYNLKSISAAATAPLFALGAPATAGGYGGTWIDRLLELVVLFDMLAVGIGCAVSASRGIFAMARDRRIPAPLASVSKRHGTPFGASCVVIGAVVVSVLLEQFTPGLFALPKTPHYFSLFSWGATFGGFALVVVYLFVAVGSIRSFARVRGRMLIFLAALLGIAITGGAIFGSFYKVTDPTLYAPAFALIWLALGVVVAFVAKGRNPASMHLADLGENPELARMDPRAEGASVGAEPLLQHD
jgi:amino acid transporter